MEDRAESRIRLPSPILYSRFSVTLLLASIWTLLNVLKPLHIDDGFFVKYAQQIAVHPLDPYGFKVFWDEWPEHALAVICPPVLPYWLAPVVRLFGPNPYLLKLWMFPFAAMFIYSLDALLRRFAPKFRPLVLAATVFSPAFLPSLNLMLDVPALALELLAVELLIRSIEKSSLSLSICAGLIAGLAIETKYIAIATPLAMLAYGIAHRRIRWAMLPMLLAFGFFALIEALLWLRYGESHFLLQSKIYGLRRDPVYLWMTEALPSYIAGTAPFLFVLSVLLLSIPRRPKVIALAVGGVAYVLLSLWASSYVTYSVAAGVIALAMVWQASIALAHEKEVSHRRATGFLLLWLALEMFLSVTISPFAATRRAMGIILVSTLLLSRFAERKAGDGLLLMVMRVAAVACIALGLCFYCVDLDDALAQRRSVDRSAAMIQRINPQANIWFTGHWGYGFYAERAGWRPLIPDNSHLRAGDWLVTADSIQHQHILPLGDAATTIETNQTHYLLPWTTTPTFYLGWTPIERRQDPSFDTQILRVKEDIVPRTAWNAGVVACFMLERQEWTPDEAVPGIVAVIKGSHEAWVADALRASLASFKPHSLPTILHDSDPSMRIWAATALGEVGEAWAIEPLQGALNDPDDTVRTAAGNALQKLNASVKH